MSSLPDFADIAGQAHAKRALQVAAAGAHSIAITGPPGVGKTMLARSLARILPPLTDSERAELIRAGVEVEARIRPVLEIDRTSSPAAVLGRVRRGRPQAGLISRAHGGAVILDELPLIAAAVRRALPDILRFGSVATADAEVRLPASVMLIVVMRPCPCGLFGEFPKRCVCTPTEWARYIAGFPPALRQEVELHVELPTVSHRELTQKFREPGAAVARYVHLARERQRSRWGEGLGRVNSRVPWAEAEPHCQIGEGGERLLRSAARNPWYPPTAREIVLRVARTIAVMDGEDRLGSAHVAEAMGWCRRRPLPGDSGFWIEGDRD